MRKSHFNTESCKVVIRSSSRKRNKKNSETLNSKTFYCQDLLPHVILDMSESNQLVVPKCSKGLKKLEFGFYFDQFWYHPQFVCLVEVLIFLKNCTTKFGGTHLQDLTNNST